MDLIFASVFVYHLLQVVQFRICSKIGVFRVIECFTDFVCEKTPVNYCGL